MYAAADKTEETSDGNSHDIHKLCCLNKVCKSNQTLIEPSSFAISYYGNGNLNSKICQSCFEIAEDKFNMLSSKFMKCEPMIHLALPAPCEVIVLSDSDEESNSINKQEDSVTYVTDLTEDEINMEIESIFTKYDLNTQLQIDADKTEARVEKLKEECENMISMFRNIEKTFDDSRNYFYDAHKPITKELESIEIIDISEPPIPTVIKKKVVNKRKPNYDGREVVAVSNVKATNVNLPPIGPLLNSVLKIDDHVFAMKSNLSDEWYKAVIIDICKQNATDILYKVRHEDRLGPTKIVSSNQIAYSNPSANRLSVGCRVIAAYYDVTNTPNSKKYYSGVIAEVPTIMNKFRYLVFFDDGYAGYTTHNEIRVITKFSNTVWDDVHPDMKHFIKEYLERYPERPMVKFQVGQSIKTELNGRWIHCKVLEVDCSLVQVQFTSNQQEWLYRGSTRLWPLYSQQVRQELHNSHPHRYQRFMDPNKKVSALDEFQLFTSSSFCRL